MLVMVLHIVLCTEHKAVETQVVRVSIYFRECWELTELIKMYLNIIFKCVLKTNRWAKGNDFVSSSPTIL